MYITGTTIIAIFVSGLQLLLLSLLSAPTEMNNISSAITSGFNYTGCIHLDVHCEVNTFISPVH